MTSITGLRVELRTPENQRFEGLCRKLDSHDSALVALVAFPSQRAPAIGLREKARLTFMGGGLAASIAAEGLAVLRSDEQSRRCYSFHIDDVPRNMLLFLANRRGSARLVPTGPVRVEVMDLPGNVPSRADLYDVSATGISLVVHPDVEQSLVRKTRLKFALMLPGEHALALEAVIRNRRTLGPGFVYGLEFDKETPELVYAREHLLAHLSIPK